MDYKVSEVRSFSEQTYGQYGNHRISFKVEGNNELLSAFAKQNFTVGQTISGEIKKTEKDGKTYHNFEFAKKVPLDPRYEELANKYTSLSLRVAKLEELANRKKVDTSDVPFPMPDDFQQDESSPF